MRLAHVNGVVDVTRLRRRRFAWKMVGLSALVGATFALGFVTGRLTSGDATATTSVLDNQDRLPLGVIYAGELLPWWSAQKSDHVYAGIDLLGYLYEGQVWLTPLKILGDSNCDNYLDAFDPSPENKYVPCPSAIVVHHGSLTGINVDLRNFFATAVEVN